MRDAFVRSLTTIAAADPRVVMLTADLGFKLFDDFARRCPGRFLNVGVAEANMVSVAAGLALDGKRPFTYSIVPFATARCLEQIRTDVCEMELPVVVIGVGGGYAYGPNGPTHHGVDDIGMMRSLPQMHVVVPCDPRETEAAVRAVFALGKPCYIRLGRSGDPLLPGTDRPFQLGVPSRLREGSGVALLACGPIAAEALKAAEELEGRGIDAAVLAAHSIKPLGELLEALDGFDEVFVVEEHGPNGGLFDAVAAGAARRGTASPRLYSISAPDRFHRVLGSAQFLRAASGLDRPAIAATVVREREARHR